MKKITKNKEDIKKRRNDSENKEDTSNFNEEELLEKFIGIKEFDTTKVVFHSNLE
jgi:hypothetical protein